MPRAGSGGSHSSSHRSSSRSSGGHRISSSHSRAGSRHGSSSSSSYHRSGPSYHSAPPPPPSYRRPGMPPPPSRRSGYRRRTYYRASPGGSIASVIVIIIVLTMVLGLMSVFFSAISSGFSKSIDSSRSSQSSSASANTRNREKLNSGVSFDNNCIIDELDWFDSVSKTGTRLKTFYDKTGVQPYIVLLQYHPELTTDSQKEEYAQDYYENNIDNESTFLYMYFAEKDQDNDVGYMCYVNGIQVDSVMDAEAVDIFWEYLDRNWYSDMSTDELFEKAFTKTAETIMP